MLRTPSQARDTFPSHSHHYRKLPTHPGAHCSSSASYPMHTGTPPQVTRQGLNARLQAIPTPTRARAIRTAHITEARQLEESKANNTTRRIALQHTYCSPDALSQAGEAVGSQGQATATLTHSRDRPRLGSRDNARDTIFHMTHGRSIAHS